MKRSYRRLPELVEQLGPWSEMIGYTEESTTQFRLYKWHFDDDNERIIDDCWSFWGRGICNVYYEYWPTIAEKKVMRMMKRKRSG